MFFPFDALEGFAAQSKQLSPLALLSCLRCFGHLLLRHKGYRPAQKSVFRASSNSSQRKRSKGTQIIEALTHQDIASSPLTGGPQLRTSVAFEDAQKDLQI